MARHGNSQHESGLWGLEIICRCMSHIVSYRFTVYIYVYIQVYVCIHKLYIDVQIYVFIFVYIFLQTIIQE